MFQLVILSEDPLSGLKRRIFKFALVVQRIEHLPPKEEMQVQFLPRAHWIFNAGQVPRKPPELEIRVRFPTGAPKLILSAFRSPAAAERRRPAEGTIQKQLRFARGGGESRDSRLREDLSI